MRSRSFTDRKPRSPVAFAKRFVKAMSCSTWVGSHSSPFSVAQVSCRLHVTGQKPTPPNALKTGQCQR